jgi:uncharacterized protein (DUF305 family)
MSSIERPVDKTQRGYLSVRYWRRGLLVALLVAGCISAGLIASSFGSNKAAASSSTPGPVDIGFCQAMIIHHQQAVTMVQDIGARASGDVEAIALGIETNQQDEIGRMQEALSLWGAPPTPTGSLMGWMGMTMAAGTGMPGLASQAQLNQLSELSGKPLDILFLQLMIRHHQSGVEMASFAASHAKLAAIRSLANIMVVDQNQEIALMRTLLQLDGARPLPFNS